MKSSPAGAVRSLTLRRQHGLTVPPIACRSACGFPAPSRRRRRRTVGSGRGRRWLGSRTAVRPRTPSCPPATRRGGEAPVVVPDVPQLGLPSLSQMSRQPLTETASPNHWCAARGRLPAAPPADVRVGRAGLVLQREPGAARWSARRCRTGSPQPRSSQASTRGVRRIRRARGVAGRAVSRSETARTYGVPPARPRSTEVTGREEGEVRRHRHAAPVPRGPVPGPCRGRRAARWRPPPGRVAPARAGRTSPCPG